MSSYRGFADLIRRRRQELGLTLAEVAPQVGWSIYHLSHLESGTSEPPCRRYLHRLAEVLQLDPELLGAEAAQSHHSVELDLERASPEQRELAAVLARRFTRGLSV